MTVRVDLTSVKTSLLGWDLVSGGSESAFAEGCDGLAPLFAEIPPGRIVGDDEADLFDARPLLQLLLSCNGTGDFGEAL